MVCQHADQLITIGLAFCGGGQVKQTAIPCRDLQSFKAGLRRPLGDSRQAVKGGGIVTELCQMQAWTFQGFHSKLQLVVD
ncbi:hypothetical protein D3C78_1902900 [compost metagenome]